MEMTPYIVYIKTGDANRITAVNSSAFLTDTTGWTQIDEGYGDKYHHAQGNYFPEPIYTEVGAYRYKLIDGKPVACTQEEIIAQEDALRPAPVPDPQDDMDAMLVDHEFRLTMLELGI